MVCHFAMIIRNEVKMSKYFLNPISPEGEDYFPSIEGFISCRQATFSNDHPYEDNRYFFRGVCDFFLSPAFNKGKK